LDKPNANQFGLIQYQGEEFLAFGNHSLLGTSELKIHGSHNHANALASLALGHAVGLSLDSMVSALKVFPGLAHRCQFVTQIKNISFYNDSKATNVGAAVAAIKGLGASLKSSAKIVLIAGGYGKGAEFIGLVDPMLIYVRHAVLLGADAEKIENVVDKKINTVRAKNMQEAVQLAQALAQPGDAVLLAPACASFDMYENFEQRGDDFVNAVKNKVIH
jgi:UDP-N-acetylmuramoylalanine--D-glutamate ligase